MVEKILAILEIVAKMSTFKTLANMGTNPIKALRQWFLVQLKYRFVTIVTNRVTSKKIVLNFKTTFRAVECKVVVVVVVMFVVLVMVMEGMLDASSS